jgi:hypothetical protein
MRREFAGRVPDLRGRLTAGNGQGHPFDAPNGASGGGNGVIPYEVVNWGICTEGHWPFPYPPAAA